MAIQPTIYRTGAPEGGRRIGAHAGETLRQLDYLLLAAVAALVAYGLWTVQSVTADDVPGDPGSFVRKQAIFAVLGVGAFVLMTLLDPERLRRARHVLFALALALMVVVLLVGSDVRGSKRWIDLSFFQLQPSELGKICLIVFVAGYLAARARALESWRVVLAVIGIAAVPTLLVFIEPDFGTALVYTCAAFGALFFAGIRWQHLAALAGLGVVVALLAVWILPSAGIDVLKPYQVDRLVGFIDPQADPSGTTYNVSRPSPRTGAVGSTGGASPARADPPRLHTEHHTDFIFALASSRVPRGGDLLLLYAIVIWRGMRIVAAAGTCSSDGRQRSSPRCCSRCSSTSA
jgi:rod shape determining protein RodA